MGLRRPSSKYTGETDTSKGCQPSTLQDPKGRALIGLVLPSSQAMSSLRRQDGEEHKKVTVVLTPQKHAFHAFRRFQARSFDFVVKTSSASLYPRALKAWAINLCHQGLSTEDPAPQIPKNAYRIVEATR